MGEGDTLKEVTGALLSRVPEMGFLRSMSLYQAMATRVDLTPLYRAVCEMFAGGLGSYEVQFRGLFGVPTRVVVRTGGGGEGSGGGPRVFRGKVAWESLPEAPAMFSNGKMVEEIVSGERDCGVDNEVGVGEGRTEWDRTASCDANVVSKSEASANGKSEVRGLPLDKGERGETQVRSASVRRGLMSSRMRRMRLSLLFGMLSVSAICFWARRKRN